MPGTLPCAPVEFVESTWDVSLACGQFVSRNMLLLSDAACACVRVCCVYRI